MNKTPAIPLHAHTAMGILQSWQTARGAFLSHWVGGKPIAFKYQVYKVICMITLDNYARKLHDHYCGFEKNTFFLYEDARAKIWSMINVCVHVHAY